MGGENGDATKTRLGLKMGVFGVDYLDDGQLECLHIIFIGSGTDKGRNKHNSLLANMVISDLFKCLK